MAQSKTAAKRTTSRPKSTNGRAANGASATRRKPTTRASNAGGSSAGSSRNGSSRNGSNRKRTTSRPAAHASAGKKATTAVVDTARKARGPALAAGATAAAVAGAALLKRQLTPKRRKVLGVSVPVASSGVDLASWISSASKRVAKTSQELGKLSHDVEQAAKSAQKVGDSLS